MEHLEPLCSPARPFAPPVRLSFEDFLALSGVVDSSAALRMAVTLPELVGKAESARKGRAGCGASFIGADPTAGVVRFRTRCPGPGHQVWEQRIKFMLWEEDRKTDPDQFGEMSWPTYISSNKDRLRASDILADCTCPDFLYMGGYAIGQRDGWAFPDGPSQGYDWPSEKNPGGVGGLCKHIISVAWGFI